MSWISYVLGQPKLVQNALKIGCSRQTRVFKMSIKVTSDNEIGAIGRKLLQQSSKFTKRKVADEGTKPGQYTSSRQALASVSLVPLSGRQIPYVFFGFYNSCCITKLQWLESFQTLHVLTNFCQNFFCIKREEIKSKKAQHQSQARSDPHSSPRFCRLGNTTYIHAH